MLVLEIRQALKSIAATAAAVMLAAVASPHHGAAAEADEPERALLDQIQEILSRDGPYARDLLAPLTNLGLFYREGEDYSFALTTL